MKILNVNNKSFEKYGKVINSYKFEKIIEQMNEITVQKEVIYKSSVDFLEETEDMEILKNNLYGGIDIQIGYCSGYNKKMNALEYHKNNEINIAVTDLILILGLQKDISEELKYNSHNLEAFLIKKGTAIEIYSTTLHYAPCSINNEIFKCLVVLPKGTNEDLDFEVKFNSENNLLFAKNKWLISHKDANIKNSKIGIYGPNIEIQEGEVFYD